MKWIFNLVTGEILWKVASYAKKQAILVALILVLVQIAVLMWGALTLIVTTAISFIPPHPLSTFALQFLPSVNTITSGLTFYFSSLLTQRMWWLWHAKIKMALYLGGHISTKF